MTKKIFWAIFGSSLIVLSLSVFLLSIFIENEIEKRNYDTMHKEALFLSEYLNNQAFDALNNIFSTNRISIITPDGKVIFDNFLSNKILDNHKNRQEVQEGLQNGIGFSKRYSNNLKAKTIYLTLKLKDGNILRVSNHQDLFFGVIFDNFLFLFIFIILVFICSILLAFYLTRLIIKPLDSFDFTNPYSSNIYDEFLPFISKITQQENLIHRQMLELKQKQEEFDTITQNMQEALLVVDSQYRILSLNKSANRLFGLVNVGDSIFGISRKKELKEVITLALSGNNSEKIFERNHRYYQVFASSVYQNQKIIGAIILILDITESKERENLRREFSANVSHELKTPLTSISGYAELIKNNLVPQKDIISFGEKIYQQAQRLLDLINDIMKIAKLDEGALPYEKEEFELYESTKHILNHLDTKNLEITIEGKCKIFGIKNLIEDMIFNLCDNAIKYNKTNGKIKIKLKGNSNKGSFSIQDTGIGISIENQQRVFERFFREDKSHSSNISGTGLGLSIIKHIANLHSFKINLESKQDIGTKIEIYWDYSDISL